MREGLLALDAAPSSELDMRAVSPGSHALALDPGRIYLHTRERFARGGLDSKDAQRAGADIKAMLEGFKIDGQRAIRKVHLGHELYQGPCLPAAPDLVIEPEPGVNLTAKLDGREVCGLHGRTGAHTVGDAFFFDSAGFTPQLMRDTGNGVLDFFGLGPHNAGSFTQHDSTIITLR
jgi:hypothetical protein